MILDPPRSIQRSTPRTSTPPLQPFPFFPELDQRYDTLCFQSLPNSFHTSSSRNLAQPLSNQAPAHSCKINGGVSPVFVSPLLARHALSCRAYANKSFRIRSYAKDARNPFRIRSYDLHRGGGPSVQSVRLALQIFPRVLC